MPAPAAQVVVELAVLVQQERQARLTPEAVVAAVATMQAILYLAVAQAAPASSS